MIKILSVESPMQMDTGQGIDLHLLGVPITYQSQTPCVAAFPKKFNQTAINIWVSVLESPQFTQFVRQNTNIDRQWNVALHMYLNKMDDLGLNPFHEDKNVTDNTQIIRFLGIERRKIARFLDRIGIFEKFKLFRPYREYERSDSGFIIKSFATLRDFGSAQNLIDFLTNWDDKVGPKFIHSGHGTYTRRLGLGPSHFECLVTTGVNAKFWYSIDVPTLPYIELPPNIDKVTTSVFNNYINRNIWLPQVRNYSLRTLKYYSLF